MISIVVDIFRFVPDLFVKIKCRLLQDNISGRKLIVVFIAVLYMMLLHNLRGTHFEVLRTYAVIRTGRTNEQVDHICE